MKKEKLSSITKQLHVFWHDKKLNTICARPILPHSKFSPGDVVRVTVTKINGAKK